MLKMRSIGTVWCQVMAGSFAMVNIVLDPAREGRDNGPERDARDRCFLISV